MLCIVLYKVPGSHSVSFRVVDHIAAAAEAGNQSRGVTARLASYPPPPPATSSVIDECPLCLDGGQTRSRNENRWYNFSASSSQPLFYAYSAFYDDRPRIPVVRIIAVSTETKNINASTEFDCLLLYANGRVIRVSLRMPQPAEIGMGLWLHGQYVREYVYTCRLPPDRDFTGKAPVGVSVRLVTNVGGRPFWTSTPGPGNEYFGAKPRCFMPVETPSKPLVRRNMAVCVQVAFGNLDPLRLVEWFELQRLLGVELIGVYASPTVGRPAMDVFRRYAAVDDGLVDLRVTNYIGPTSSAAFNVMTSNQHLLQGSPVINDCMYRHMHSFKYIGVYDFDEVGYLNRCGDNDTSVLHAEVEL